MGVYVAADRPHAAKPGVNPPVAVVIAVQGVPTAPANRCSQIFRNNSKHCSWPGAVCPGGM